jgi:WD40 repeat protein
MGKSGRRGLWLGIGTAIGILFATVVLLRNTDAPPAAPPTQAPAVSASLGWAVLNSDATLLVTGHLFFEVRLWEVKTEKELWRIEVRSPDFEGCILGQFTDHRILFSRDGKSIAFRKGPKVIVVDVATGHETGTLSPGVLSFGHEDNSSVVEQGNEILTLDGTSGAILKRIANPKTDPLSEWDVSPDGKLLAVGSGERVRVVDSKGESVLDLPGLPNCGWRSTFSRDLKELWIHAGRFVQVWNVSQGKRLRSLTLPEPDLALSMAITREGRIMVAVVPGRNPGSNLPVRVSALPH